MAHKNLEAQIQVVQVMISLSREVDRVRIFEDEIGRPPKRRDAFIDALKELLEDLEAIRESEIEKVEFEEDIFGEEDF